MTRISDKILQGNAVTQTVLVVGYIASFCKYFIV